jgi:hypothetical protein
MKAKLLVIIALIFLFFRSLLTGRIYAVKTGQKAPDFTFEIAPGKTARLSDFKGKVVWNNFFHLVRSLPAGKLPLLQKDVYDIYKNNKNFVLIIQGREHSWNEINKFAKEQGYPCHFTPTRNAKSFRCMPNKISRGIYSSTRRKVAVASTGLPKKNFRRSHKKWKHLSNESKKPAN